MYSLQPNEQAFINAIIATAESVHEVRPAVNNHAIFPGFTGEPIHGDPEKAAFAEGLFAGHEHRIPASLPVNLTTVIYPDTTAEVSSVLDQVSGLFEDGVGAEDILILSPAVKETVRLIDDIIDDFSIRNPDGTRTRISYTAATARPISNYPETAALLAVLKAPVADYPLATLLQLLTLPQIRKKFGIHTSQLFSLSQTLGITRGKSNWITIADQRIPFLLQKIEDAGTDSQSAKFYQVQIDELQKLQQGLISLIEEITPKNQKKQSVRQHCRSVRCQQNSSSGRKRSMISSRVLLHHRLHKPSVSLMPSSVTHFPNCAAALLPRSLLVPLNTPSPLPDSESRPSPLQITSLFSVFPTSPSLAFNLLFRI